MMKKNWNEKEIKELKSLYPVMNTGKLALHFGHPLSSVYAKAHALGLRKSEEFFRSPESGRFSNTRLIEGGIRTRFKKGHIPANKGKRMSEYMSAESIEKSKATRRSEEHTSELQSRQYLVCRLLLEKKNNTRHHTVSISQP